MKGKSGNLNPDLTEDMIAKIEDVGGNDMSVRIESLDMGTWNTDVSCSKL